MNWMSKLRFGLARLLVKAGSLAIVPAWVTESFIIPSFRALVREAYKKNAAVFACLEVLAFAFPEAQLRIYDGDSEDAQPLPNHPLRKLLNRPNPRMGEAELLLITIVYAAIGGNAYWHKVRGRAGQVVELWPYHAGQMRAVPGGPTWILRYEYDNGDGIWQPIPVEDIVHFKWPSPDPEQPWQAQPPLAAAGREVDTDNEITRYLFALLKNDAVPRLALKLPAGEGLKDPEIRRMKQQWRERYGGDNRGDIAILEQGAEIQRVGLDLAELTFDALHRIPETRIAAVLRVPAILAGLAAGLERSTFANFKEARQLFAEGTLIPLWRLFASEIASDLGPEFRAPDVRFDISRVQALQEDTTARWKRALDAFQRGILKRNEARRYIGYADAQGGDIFYEAPQRSFPGSESAKAFPFAVESTKGSKPAYRASARQSKASVDTIEAQIKRAVKSYLSSQYDLAADAIRDLDKKSSPIDPAIVEQLGLDLGPAIRRTLSRFYPLLLQRAFEDAGLTLDQDLAFDLANPKVQLVLDQLADLVQRVAETTKDDIRALVGLQASEGWSIAELAEHIAELSDIHSTNRATVVARTESASAYSQGSILAYQESGVVSAVEWDATLDDTTATTCKALHGTRAALGSAFADGTRFPPQHPNCRCALIPILE